MKGAFITFEGCEGVGKSTQLRLLKDYLDKTGQPAVFTREPGGTDIAEAIRNIILNPENNVQPIVEAYLFAAARADHVRRKIMPALAEGKLVICDRYLDSSLAYQGYARELGMEEVWEINRYAVGDCIPDCTVFLDLPPKDSWRRKSGKEIVDDRMENESLAFHNKVYEGFCELKDAERYACIIPKEDKLETCDEIIKVLKDRGLIR